MTRIVVTKYSDDRAYFADVGNVFALLDLQLVVHLFPVVCHCVNAVSSSEGLCQGGLVIDVSLRSNERFEPT